MSVEGIQICVDGVADTKLFIVIIKKPIVNNLNIVFMVFSFF